MESLEYYNKLKTPPSEALKPIAAGRLKGKTDISPQWRIEKMTEVFGICGFGWKYQIVKTWTEPASDNQIFAFLELNLFYKIGDIWSDAIPSIGGTLMVVSEKNGMYSNDEAYKMSLTDALGNAMKALGMAADVYMGKLNNGGDVDTSKYQSEKQQVQQPKREIEVWASSKDVNAILKLVTDGQTERVEEGLKYWSSENRGMSKANKELIKTAMLGAK